MISTKLAILGTVGAGAATTIYYLLPASEENELEAGATSVKQRQLQYHQLRSGYCGTAHPSKRHLNPDPTKLYASFGAGEDSGFLSPRSVGIGDGVGGWSRVKNANVALFSRLLMHHCQDFLQSASQENGTGYLVSAMRHALTQIPDEVIGSTTCTLVSFNPTEGRFESANVGDSNFLVVRDSKLEYKGEISQVRFNFPKQLGTRGHDPEDAIVESVLAEEGDILVLGSDGLFDNLFVDEIVQIINDNTSDRGRVRAEKAAQGLVKETIRIWSNPRDGPFAKEAQSQGQYYSGSKKDDICVIVSQLLEPMSKM